MLIMTTLNTAYKLFYLNMFSMLKHVYTFIFDIFSYIERSTRSWVGENFTEAAMTLTLIRILRQLVEHNIYVVFVCYINMEHLLILRALLINHYVYKEPLLSSIRSITCYRCKFITQPHLATSSRNCDRSVH